VLVIRRSDSDQPARHKYRLTVEVETPEGKNRPLEVLAVQPDRGYSRRGHTRTMGDAVLLISAAAKNLIALLAHVDKSIDLDGMNYLALRAYNMAGRKVSFNDMSRMTGPVPVQGALIPVLVTFAIQAIPRPRARCRRMEWLPRWARGFTSMASRSRRCRMVFGRSISEAR
jgi:hypothetical protein